MVKNLYNGTLVSGHMDSSLQSPGGEILTHTHMGPETSLDGATLESPSDPK